MLICVFFRYLIGVLTQFTFHKSLTEKVVEDSCPIAFHLAVIVAAFEHLFHKATTKRCPVSGPAQIWKQKLFSV